MKDMLMFRLVLLSLVLFWTGGINYAATAPPVDLLQAAGLSPADPPKTAPPLELIDSEGNPVRLQAHRGKVILINFWATWCPPCIHEMPMMEALYIARKDQAFSIWAINMSESQKDVAHFMAQKGFHFPVMLDLEGTATSSYAVQGLPSTYLIDCAGNLLGHVIGILEWTSDATRDLLDALLSDAACQ
jgi:thiol-disulfide isomerase/thioredoxin